ncbi:uncharacterized protein METZ01_LOCUS4733 [marine metagenome]|uniref:Uncharacterized protein n=1 Tax=marine metagenome TaxID=408172 RepID=A0A381NBR7_9ZZZZ
MKFGNDRMFHRPRGVEAGFFRGNNQLDRAIWVDKPPSIAIAQTKFHALSPSRFISTLEHTRC